jgi:hypothetical protein
MQRQAQELGSQVGKQELSQNSAPTTQEQLMTTATQKATFSKIADRNYEKSMGWSTFRECFGKEEIDQFFFSFEEEDEAEIEDAMQELVSIWDDRHADAQQYRDEAREDCHPCGDCGEGVCDYCNPRHRDYA